MSRLLVLYEQGPEFIVAIEKLGNNYINVIFTNYMRYYYDKTENIEFTFTSLCNFFPYWD